MVKGYSKTFVDEVEVEVIKSYVITFHNSSIMR